MLALSGGKLGEKKSAPGLIEPGSETPPASFSARRGSVEMLRPGVVHADRPARHRPE